jgi:hypothetical protein
VLIECVQVCNEYSDFLAETLPHNKSQVDRLIVVTAPEDVSTIQLCDYWDVEVVKTDALGTRWGDWHKGRGIQAGLDQFKFDGWALHLDADIALPPRTRALLERADLDKTTLYGVDRQLVPSYDAWRDHLALPHIQTDGYHVRPGGFEVMPRFNAWHLHGYTPAGYFQLWHPHTSGIKTYPSDHNGGDRTDVLFSQQWDRSHRQLLPEFLAYHLESEKAPMGANWGGRRTRHFGPEPRRRPDDYRHRRYDHHRHHRDRHEWPVYSEHERHEREERERHDREAGR